MEQDAAASAFARGGEIGALLRGRDWSCTPLGPVSTWPQSLRTAVRIMLDSRYQMWMAWGPELHVFYNDAYRPTLGAKHPQALGMPTRELWAEVWDEIRGRIEQVLRTGEATWDEGLQLLLERQGFPEETYHTFSYSPLYDDDGQIGGMLCVVMEETERVIGERRLSLLRELAGETAPARSVEDVCAFTSGCLERYRHDLPFAVAYVAEAGETLLRRCFVSGIAPEHAAAPKYLAVAEDVHSPWPVAEVLAHGKSVLVTDLATRFGTLPSGVWAQPPTAAILLPLSQQGQDAPAGVLILALNPYRPFDPEFRGFVDLVAGQVTKAFGSVFALEAARKRAEALAELDRAKTTFFSNVSHEFRTPLTLMLGPVEDALATPEHALSGENLDTVHRNSVRLLKLVNNLLDFSRIEAGRIEAVYQPTDLARYTAELASVFRSATERAGIKLVVDCGPLPEPIYLDREMWEKVVLNLLSNAFKFTLEGEIIVRTQALPDGVEVSVRDTGCGIPSEELPHLFERFHRVPGARGRTSEGTGIGLALVQELVRLHGGTVQVESVPEHGSTFRILLPYGSGHLPAERLNTDRRLASTALGANAFVEEALRWLPYPNSDAPLLGHSSSITPTSGGTTTRPRARVLLADDNADMRAYLERLLSEAYDVETVADGQAALAAARRQRPDLVLTDVMMPRLDGFGLLRALRSDRETRDLPIILLSARAGEEARVEGLEAGADDYLVKPFSARELLARIYAHLEMAHLRREAAEQQRSLQLELDTERLRLREIFLEAPAPMATLRGPKHVFEFTNPRYLELVGRPDILGLPVAEALPEVESQGFVALLDQVYTTGKPFVGREALVRLLRTGASELEDVYVDFVYLPLREADGSVSGIFVHAVEITEQVLARRRVEALAEQNQGLYEEARRAEAAARDRAEALAQADRQKDEFLAMLAHELRNPLAPVLNAIQVLQALGTTDPVVQRQRSLIDRQARHMARLLDDLLDVSRITRGKIILKTERLELRELIQQVAEVSRPLFEERGQQFTVTLPAEPVFLEGDPTRLHQVVGNLLNNAAKYTPTGGRIELELAVFEDEAALCVTDDGAGIEPELLPRVFDLFVQADRSLSRPEGGLGIGLTMVQQLVHLHGGRVEAISPGAGRGSTFMVRLPLSASQRVIAPEAMPAKPAHAESAARRILIVDDNVDAGETLGDLVSLWGHEVQVVHSGPAALAAAPAFQPEVVLLDISMPGMDGYEVARGLRADSRLEGVTLYALTGYGQEEDRRRSREAGFHGHLTKPVDPDTIRKLLERPGSE